MIKVAGVAGVGAATAKRLERLGITTVEDLLKHYPRRYEDYSNLLPINAIKPGPVTIRGQFLQVASRRALRNPRLSITEAIISDGTGTIKAIWFNQPYLKNTLPIGKEVLISGKLEFRNQDLALQGPTYEAVGDNSKHTARIVPVYPETVGLTSKQLRNLIMPLLPLAEGLPDPLPVETIKNNKLLPYSQALRAIHFPQSQHELDAARHRLAFEELFFLMLTSLVIKREIQTETAPIVKFDPGVAKQFTDALDFSLTDAQRQAAWQILQDLERSVPMNRLLEGDVGSGKTVVAAMAATMAMSQGHQVALLVPTEILARQHFAKIGPLVESLGYKSELIMAKSKTKTSNVDSLASNLFIGTHALLSKQIEFINLGLVIIDEQHRFGVSQRQAIKQKAGQMPHLLSMTATPIPRSLALTVYGDLDISIIDSLPPGRQPITTQVVNPGDRDKVYAAVDAQISQGRQVFVVCPLIEDSDKLGAKSVTTEADRLQKGMFKHRRIGLLHGRLKSDQKQAVMDQFSKGELDILVATTVVEVGIDIPNASVMMIEGADRYGLAALHQLRGRIGRGLHASRCYLLTDNTSPEVNQRLQAMERTSDGFRLAQIDMEMRGPGQIYGTAQHGRLDLQMASLSDVKLIETVRLAANEFLQNTQNLVKYPLVAKRINQLKTVTSLD